MKFKKRKKPDKKETLDFFDKGFSCSQSVLGALAPGLGLSRIKALRVASAYGGGICRRGDLCGAVTGGLMAIGLKFGHANAQDLAAKEKTYRIAQEFIQWFEKRYSTLLCRELLGAGKKKNKSERLKFHSEICRKIVKSTAEYIDHMR